MTSTRSLLIILAIIVALAAVKMLFLSSPKSSQPASGAGNAPPAAVSIMVLKEELAAPLLEFTGSLRANEEVELRAELPGKINGIYFREGQAVSRGTLLLRINDDELRAQLAQVNASIRLSKQRLERSRKLLAINGISQEEFDVISTEAEGLEAEKELLEARLGKTEIRAPFDGICGLRQYSEGAYLSGQEVVASLRQLSPLKIEFSVPEELASRVQPGDSIEFSNGNDSRNYMASVYAKESGIDENTRSIRVRALYPNRDQQMLPGGFVRISLRLKAQPVIRIPTQAIVPVLKGKQVFLFRGGKADTVSIRTGYRDEGFVTVSEGLKPGDTLITTGIMQLRAGSPVKPKG